MWTLNTLKREELNLNRFQFQWCQWAPFCWSWVSSGPTLSPVCVSESSCWLSGSKMTWEEKHPNPWRETRETTNEALLETGEEGGQTGREREALRCFSPLSSTKENVWNHNQYCFCPSESNLNRTWSDLNRTYLEDRGRCWLVEELQFFSLFWALMDRQRDETAQWSPAEGGSSSEVGPAAHIQGLLVSEVFRLLNLAALQHFQRSSDVLWLKRGSDGFTAWRTQWMMKDWDSNLRLDCFFF